MSAVLTGGCECGAIRYECCRAHHAGHCHCRCCGKASGTGHASNLMVSKAAMTIKGDARFYERAAESGNRVRRGFCPICGAVIYGESSGWPDVLTLWAGSLDDPELFRPGMIIYAGDAPSWDRMDPALPSHARMLEQVIEPARSFQAAARSRPTAYRGARAPACAPRRSPGR